MKYLLCLVFGHHTYGEPTNIENVYDLYCSRCMKYFGMEDTTGQKVTEEEYENWMKGG